jgi:hypothetical protein
MPHGKVDRLCQLWVSVHIKYAPNLVVGLSTLMPRFVHLVLLLGNRAGNEREGICTLELVNIDDDFMPAKPAPMLEVTILRFLSLYKYEELTNLSPWNGSTRWRSPWRTSCHLLVCHWERTESVEILAR